MINDSINERWKWRGRGGWLCIILFGNNDVNCLLLWWRWPLLPVLQWRLTMTMQPSEWWLLCERHYPIQPLKWLFSQYIQWPLWCDILRQRHYNAREANAMTPFWPVEAWYCGWCLLPDPSWAICLTPVERRGLLWYPSGLWEYPGVVGGLLKPWWLPVKLECLPPVKRVKPSTFHFLHSVEGHCGSQWLRQWWPADQANHCVKTCPSSWYCRWCGIDDLTRRDLYGDPIVGGSVTLWPVKCLNWLT